jgi:hypothetical protein
VTGAAPGARAHSSGHAILILESEHGEQDKLCRRHHERPARSFDICR